MSLSDDDLIRVLAYVDGEMPATERAAFEAETAANPELAAAVAAHRGLGARVSATYEPVLAEPVPPALTMLAAAANDRAPARFGLPQWAAMAACLVVGVFAGRLALPTQTPLDRSLSTQLAADSGPIRIGLTFRDTAGRYCRTFRSEPDRLAGLACRQDDRWRVQVATAFDPASTAYRTAGSETPPAVLAAVDALRAGEPLDAAAEKAARDKGWKP
jgi:hypothetical protein